ncbi:MAG: Ig domain-containing protein [Nanobdellota archaeon]
MKRAQITIFIIIGIVILAIAGLLFSLTFSEPLSKDIDAKSLEPYVSECLRGILKDSVEVVSAQGGFIIPPNDSIFLSEYISVPYFYADEKKIPSKEIIEEQIEKYIVMSIPMCQLDVFEKQSFDLEKKEPSPKVSITDGEVSVNLDYPITLKKGNVTIQKNTFSAKTKSRLGEFHLYAKKLSETIAKIKRVPLSDIVIMGSENDFFVDIIHANESVIYRLYDNKSIPESYNFAVLYDVADSNVKEKIEKIPSQTAHVGYEYTYDFNMKYISADTDMFNITDGIINFTPEYKDKGRHLIMVSSSNDWTYMNLTVKSENDPPHIEPISDRALKVGEDFIYSVKCLDNNTTFYNAVTDLAGFEIDLKTGDILFTPTLGQAGKHNITIVVVDEYGQKDNETFQVNIYE